MTVISKWVIKRVVVVVVVVIKCRIFLLPFTRERAVVIINVLYIPLCTECPDPDNNERFADPTDVYGFYECKQGVPVKKKCRAKFKWNKVEKDCKHPLCKQLLCSMTVDVLIF